MFIYYNEKPVKVKPTMQEILENLTNQQKIQILDAFAKGIKPDQLKHKINISGIIIVHLYKAISAIEEKSRLLMRGEVLITSAEYNEEGIEVKSAVYNKPITTALQLKNAIKADFVNEFTETQVTAVLQKMVKYSKCGGSGSWEFYSKEVVK